MINYGSLVLGDILMHTIIKSTGVDGPKFEPLLTDLPVELDPKDISFLTSRFQEALMKRATPVLEDADATTTTTKVVREHWHSADLILASQELAKNLVLAQTGTAKAGMLVVADAEIENETFLLVAKVEHQEAMRAEPKTNTTGSRYLQIERIRDLVFGDQTKIYKIAVIAKGASDQEPLLGELADSQNGTGLAQYFLGGFLGMKLADEPQVLTEMFLGGVTKAINNSEMSPDDKITAQTALAIELQSNATTMDTADFIQNHIPVVFQGSVGRLAQSFGTPMSIFSKDTTRVNSKINKTRIDLSGGVYLVAPTDVIGSDKVVRVETVESESSAKDEVLIRISGATLGSVTSSGMRG